MRPRHPLRHRLAPILLMLLAKPAAALQITLQPQPLRQGQPASVLLDNRNSCRFPLQQAVNPRQRGNVLEVEIRAEDFCDARLPGETRELPLGILTSEVELVRVLYCVGNAPPGAEPCSVALQSAVLPGSTQPAAHPVPLSPTAPLLAGLLVLLIGSRRIATAATKPAVGAALGRDRGLQSLV